MSRNKAALKFAASRYVRSRTDLSPLARLVLEELIDRHNGRQGGAWPSQEFLAARLGRGLTQIKGAIREARRAGMLRVGKATRPRPCGYSHNLYIVDIELLAARDPDRAGDLDVADGALAMPTASPPTPTAAAGKPTCQGRKSDETTVGKPTTNNLENTLENGARERARETRRSAPPSPAMMAGYADRREEEQRHPRRESTTGGAAVMLGDVLTAVENPDLRAVLSGLRRTMAGPDRDDTAPIKVSASISSPIIVRASSVVAAP